MFLYRRVISASTKRTSKSALRQAKERYIRIPTFRQMKDPAKDTPEGGSQERGSKRRACGTSILNLFRIAGNAPKAQEASMGR